MNAYQEQAFNAALEDRTRLASALYSLVVATQTAVCEEEMQQAAQDAIDVLVSVGGPAVSPGERDSIDAVPHQPINWSRWC